mmetsp:Transcript_26534/g.60629  ORF Transcript_26534/g.60629 Transcript_26534/m.60629 type:complete len:81 (+) Transcript_26534:3701-3943(+)
MCILSPGCVWSTLTLNHLASPPLRDGGLLETAAVAVEKQHWMLQLESHLHERFDRARTQTTHSFSTSFDQTVAALPPLQR